MREPAFCICENKDADQLCGNRTSDERLCFSYIDCKSLFFLNREFQASGHLSGCTARFVSDLVENPEDLFSRHEAHMKNLAACIWLV